ncbi:hypothetical protein ACFYKX_11075 [Cytobacillus sp. FJAT-54145]|uniref:Uncharacterized protein n=1 Tax=Cytobacillus spartinae TaxID=3299023 RepID=A0ABW6KA84_9BACI
MEQKEIEHIVKEYLKKHLSIDVEKKGGQYGSKSYIEIQLKLGNEVISETWIND